MDYICSITPIRKLWKGVGVCLVVLMHSHMLGPSDKLEKRLGNYVDSSAQFNNKRVEFMLPVWGFYLPATTNLKRGVYIVVGTPGRIKDYIERGNIDLRALNFRVLDESDEMLRMGFVEDVELIIGKVEDASKFQTLLFSAVKQIAAKFLKPYKNTADLVGNEKMKASTSGGRTIFTETNDTASTLAGLFSGPQALHWDIQQMCYVR